MILYGLLFLVLVYLALHYFYSVQYLGATTLYGSSVTQALFPGEKSMPPIWGTNSIGMMNPNPAYGQGDFWPQQVPYQAKKSGSGGPSPSGGARIQGILSWCRIT